MSVAVVAQPEGRGVVGAATSSSLAGSQGTDASLPATSSATIVSGHGEFANLKVTVNQTQELVDQAVSVSWSGGPPTFSDSSTPGFSHNFGGDYLQMFECWSQDAQTDPTPEQCEFGAEATTAASYPVSFGTAAYERALSKGGWTCNSTAPPSCLSYEQYTQLAATNPAVAHVDSAAVIDDPFHAVDGTVIPASVNYNFQANGLPYAPFDLNPYFNHTTSNELDFARTYSDGTGQVLFEVDTGLQAPGLGCGQQVLDNSTATPACWLVVVPRGTPVEENPAELQAQTLVVTSPLASQAWVNHISIPLQFQPIGTSCSISGTVRRVVGGELAAPAIASWQPTLCGQPGAPAYSYSAFSEDTARSQLVGGGSGGAGMAVMSSPVDPSLVDPTSPLVYAPLTLSAAVVGLNIQRTPALDAQDNPIADELPLAGKLVTEVNLTPRLVAKLLTESYQGQFFPSPPTTSAYSWLAKNPTGLLSDPDFLQFNPEFSLLVSPQTVASGGLVVEQPASDMTALLWQWIMADPEAKAWLDGQPDEWGMKVNPYYSTSASVNPAGVAFDTPALNTFPKSDPYCWTPPNTPSFEVNGQPDRPLCFQDWTPYVNRVQDAAADTRAANTGSKTTQDLSAITAANAWKADGPQVIGNQLVMSVTDSADAARYGLQMASLSRAGDDGSSRQFVAPTSAGLLSGEQAMQPSAVEGVLAPNPATTTSGAYPLTMLAYAAAAPLGLDQSARQDYANFLTYAAGAGQTPGVTFGALPVGYVPLPDSLVSQAQAAAATILDPSSLEPTTTTTTPSTTTTMPSSTTTTPSTTTTTSPTASGITGATAPPSTAPTPPQPTQAQSLAPGITPSVTVPIPSVVTSTTRSSAGPALTPGPPVPIAPASVVGRSPATRVGFVRWFLPLVLLMGLVSGIGLAWPDTQRWLRRRVGTKDSP